jgi:hypothetical protein
LKHEIRNKSKALNPNVPNAGGRQPQIPNNKHQRPNKDQNSKRQIPNKSLMVRLNLLAVGS